MGPDNLKLFKKESDVKEVLDAVRLNAHEFDGVIVLALRKNSTQELFTSTMSMYEKVFLAAFLQAWVNKWFRIGEDN